MSVRTARRGNPGADPARLTWTTAHGDTVSVFPGRAATGNPQRWYWHLRAANGRIIAFSGQGFRRPRSAIRSATRSFPPASS